MRSLSIWHFAGAYILVILISSFIHEPLDQQTINMESGEQSNTSGVAGYVLGALYAFGAYWSGYRLKISLRGKGFLTFLAVSSLGLGCYLLSSLQIDGLEGLGGRFWSIAPKIVSLRGYVYTFVHFALTYLLAWAVNKAWREKFPAKSIIRAALCLQFAHFFLRYFLLWIE